MSLSAEQLAYLERTRTQYSQRAAATGVFNVKRYGAEGNGTADDTDAIRDAIDACAANRGGTVFFPRGTYLITAPLEVHDNTDGNFATNIRLVAESVVGGGPYDTMLVAGANMGSMLEFHTRKSAVHGLTFWCGDFTVTRAIDATKALGPGSSGSCTGLQFHDCMFQGGNGDGSMADGITIGRDLGEGDQGNCDFFTIERCVFENLEKAIHIDNITRQSMGHRIRDCQFGLLEYGVYSNVGSWNCEDCGFGLVDVCFKIERLSEPVSLYNLNVESCGRLILADSAASAAHVVNVFGGRFDCYTGLHADGRYINMAWPGPLNLHGCLFSGESTSNFKILHGSPNFGRTNCVGCHFHVASPFENGGTQYRTLLGNLYSLDGGNAVVIPDQTSGS